MPEIVVKFADKIIERVVTEKEHITIGRNSDNDIVLDNRGVSRIHAQIEFSDKGALIIDNESLNGTFVNKRKIDETFLSDEDKITIGKFDMIYHLDSGGTAKVSDMEGTMILNTKKQREMVDQDQVDQKITVESGCSVLISADQSIQFKLKQEVITLGRAKFADIKVKGFFLPKLQAKIVLDGESYTLFNIGKKSKTQVNGEAVDNHVLRNGDIVEVGKSVFRYIEGS